MDLNNLALMTPTDGYTATQFTRLMAVSGSISQFFSDGDKNSPIGAVSNGALTSAVSPWQGWVNQMGNALFAASVGHITSRSFNNSVKGSDAERWAQSQIGSSQWLQVGHAVYDLFFPYICSRNNVTFSQFQGSNASTYAQQLASHVTSSQFYNTEIVGKINNPIDLAAYLNLYLYKIQKLGGNSVADPVLSHWRGQSEFSSLPYLGQFSARDVLNRTDGKYWDWGLFSGQAVNAANTYRSRTEQYAIFCNEFTCSYGDYVAEEWFGEALASWVGNSSGWFTGSWPNSHATHGPPSIFGSCLKPGTMIAMAQGTSKNVEEIKAGDSVSALSADGKLVEDVVSFVYVRPRKYRPLYGFEGGAAPFFTDEHVLITSHNQHSTQEPAHPQFVAVTPANSRHENPTIEVAVLKDGVSLARLTGEGITEFKVGKVICEQSSLTGNDEYPVYNLVMTRHHVYFANSFAVFDMMPDFSKFPNMSQVGHRVWAAKAKELNSLTSETQFQNLLTKLSKDVDAHLRGETVVDHPDALNDFRAVTGLTQVFGFASDTAVKTVEGEKPIGRVKAGDEVVTATGQTAKVMFAVKSIAKSQTPLQTNNKHQRDFFSSNATFVNAPATPTLFTIAQDEELTALVLDQDHTHYVNGELVYDSFPNFAEYPQAAVFMSQWWGMNAPKWTQEATQESISALVDRLVLTIHYSVLHFSTWSENK